MKKLLLFLSFFVLTLFVNGQAWDAVKVGTIDTDSIMKGDETIWVKPTGCSGTVTIFGEEYPVVQIGEQCWLGKNLHYDDLGGNIYSYDNNISISDEYGFLYTWAAAMRVDTLIDGWHIPSRGEFLTLISYTGKSLSGGKIKEEGTDHWKSPNTGATNESGFTAFGGGFKNNATGLFITINERAMFFSTTLNSNTVYYMRLNYNDVQVNATLTANKLDALSIRLIKD